LKNTNQTEYKHNNDEFYRIEDEMDMNLMGYNEKQAFWRRGCTRKLEAIEHNTISPPGSGALSQF
jgi:hypothetical protein